jgi:hypothetical protein
MRSRTQLPRSILIWTALIFWTTLANVTGFSHQFRFTSNSFVKEAATSAPDFSSLSSIRWYHAPKTGTSFYSTLLFYCDRNAMDQDGCLDDDVIIVSSASLTQRNWTHCLPRALAHEPLQAQPHLNVLSRKAFSSKLPPVVGLFRDPADRLLSAFYAGRHSMPHQLAAQITSLEEYIHFPGVLGCQAKMLVGYPCFNEIPLPISPADLLQKAIDVIKNRFIFVGITSRWSQTVCLFHAMYGGKIHPCEFKNVRPNRRRDYLESQSQEDVQALLKYVDPVDRTLFEFASNWFEEQLAVHRTKVDECLALSASFITPPATGHHLRIKDLSFMKNNHSSFMKNNHSSIMKKNHSSP